MKLKSVRFACACAMSFSTLWILCSALVWISPSTMSEVSSHMLHLDTVHFSFTLTLEGFLKGLVSWSLLGAVSGLLIAESYNLLLRGDC
jgi:hypothetical protein